MLFRSLPQSALQEYAASMPPSPTSLSPPDVRLQLFFLTVPVLSYPQATLNTFCQKSPALRRRIFCFFKHALRFQYLYFIVAHCYLQRKLTSLIRLKCYSVTVHTPLSPEVFWHEYAKIPRHASQNSIAAGNLE